MTTTKGTSDYLDAYFERIKYNGAPSVDLETLQSLHYLHPIAIPFENLSPLAGRPVRLDTESLKCKLIDGGRGGYCFEHNLLFKHVLDSIGFETLGLGARVLWGHGDDEITALDHCLLLITLDGTRYIADVGFGGMSFTAPLLLQLELEQKTSHQVYRIVALDATTYLVQVKVRDTWRSMYRFDLYVRYGIDYEMANFYTYSYPTSHFLHTLMVSKLGPDTTSNLINNQLTIYHEQTHQKEEKEINSARELRTLLQERFGLNLGDIQSNGGTTEFDNIFSRFTPQP